MLRMASETRVVNPTDTGPPIQPLRQPLSKSLNRKPRVKICDQRVPLNFPGALHGLKCGLNITVSYDIAIDAVPDNLAICPSVIGNNRSTN